MNKRIDLSDSLSLYREETFLQKNKLQDSDVSIRPEKLCFYVKYIKNNAFTTFSYEPYDENIRISWWEKNDKCTMFTKLKLTIKTCTN